MEGPWRFGSSPGPRFIIPSVPIFCDLTWAHLIVAGIGFDIAGALIVAFSLAATTGEKLAHDVPIHGISFGLPHIALGSARQRAEARLGIVLLVGGFLMQALAYFFPHPESSLDTTRERLLGLGVMGVAWLASAVAYKLYVPWSTNRTYDQAQSLAPKG